MYSEEKKREYILLRAEKLSFREIAKRMGVSVTTLLEWEKDLGTDVANAKAEVMQDVISKYKLSVAEIIESYAVPREKILTELQKRDFSNMHTRELLSLLTKIDTVIADYKPAEQAKMKAPESMITNWKNEVELTF